MSRLSDSEKRTMWGLFEKAENGEWEDIDGAPHIALFEVVLEGMLLREFNRLNSFVYYDDEGDKLVLCVSPKFDHREFGFDARFDLEKTILEIIELHGSEPEECKVISAKLRDIAERLDERTKPSLK